MSPRKRKTDHWLPQRVYRGKSAFEYHPKSGGAVRLCGLDATKSQVFQALAETLNEGAGQTCRAAAKEYFASHAFNNLSVRGQKDYRNHWKKLDPVFGRVPVESVTDRHIKQYKYLRGKTSTTMANREVKFLRVLFKFAFDPLGWISKNPAEGISMYPEKARNKYITDKEYQSFYKAACETLQIFMEISYVCAARGQDVRKITLNDITDEGLLIAQQKTGKRQIKLWSPRLRAAVNRAMELRKKRNPLCTHLLVSEHGKPYSEDGLKSLWRRAKAKHGPIDFTFHDIKAKGISDFEGDKQNFSGHKSRSQMERYNRSPDKTTVIDWRK